MQRAAAMNRPQHVLVYVNSGAPRAFMVGYKPIQKPMLTLNSMKTHGTGGIVSRGSAPSASASVGHTTRSPALPQVAGQAEAAGARVNQRPYDPRSTEAHLRSTLQPGETMTSSTLPNASKQNVRLAGKELKLDMPNGEKITVPFDQRGFPIFDKYSKFETKLTQEIWLQRDRTLHFKEATQHLKTALDSGSIRSNQFSMEQLQAIYKGNAKIPGFTWHHDLQKLQLIPAIVHNHPSMKHVGGFAMTGN